MSPQDRRDLVAYLIAVGDGERAYENDGVAAELKEANDFASVLDTAIPAHDTEIISLAVNTIGLELRELAEDYPGPPRHNAFPAASRNEHWRARH